MADTLTPNYGWVKPEVAASAATWGAKQNGVFDQIDAQVFANAQAGVAIGSGALWFTPTPPANWLICNGASLDTTTYAKLFAVFGYTYGGSGANFLLPNFVNAFPMGAGTLAATGGEATHLLTTAEMPVHPHPIVDVTHTHGASQPAHVHPDPGHTHGVNDPGHVHGGTMRQANGFFALAAQNPQITSSQTDPATTGISIQAGGTGLQAAGGDAVTVAASSTGLSTTQNAGGGAAHNTLPPYLSINFIVRYQ
jgi:microcystin-dependent protein